MEKIHIAEIRFGPRVREDLGDLEELARSIERHGLLHPPILGQDKRLIVGMRRVMAYRHLDLEEIEVRWVDELPEDERLALELEENIRRKDLTAYERSRGLMQQAEAMANRLCREAQADAENPSNAHDNPVPGRPQKADADTKVAEAIGVSQPALSLAKQHVAAIEKYPELREMTQRGALDTAKALDGLPKDAREQRRDMLRAPAAPPQADDQAQAPTIMTATTHSRRPADPDRFWLQAMHNLSVFRQRTEKTEYVRQRASRWSPQARGAYLDTLRQLHERVTHLIGEIEQVTPEPAPEDSTGEAPAAEEPTVAVTDERAKLRLLPANVTQMPEGVPSAQEPERPEQQDDATDAMESHAPLRAEAPRDTRDFEACRDECLDHIKTWRASRVSWSEAARQLQAEGMPTPNGVESWNHQAVKRLAEKRGID